MTADELLDGKVAGGPQMSADALLDTPIGPGAGAPVLEDGNNGRNGSDGFSVDVNVSGGPGDDLPGRRLVPAAEGFSVDMGAEQAVALRDRVVDAQLKVDDERLNARVFKPGDNPWRVVDGELIVDPARFGLATDMMWRFGVIDSDRYAKMLAAAPDVEALEARRLDLVRRAGTQPELKAALEGAGVAGAAVAGGMGAGAVAGRVTAGLPKPVAVGATLLAGAVGAVASGAAADAAVEEVAKYNAAADALLAAKELKPGYNLAGSLATIAVPVPGALRNVSTAINALRAEKGAAEATKFAASVLGGGAAFGAAVDAGSQLAHGKIFDALHPELQPMLRAEMERQAVERGEQLEQRPEFSPASLGISTALGALTAGMGVKARNKMYAPDELVAMENRVLSQRGSREDVQDYDVMRRAVATLRNDEGLLAADGVRRATVDVYGAKVLDVTEIVNPRFRMAALADAGVNGRNGRNGSDVRNVPALVESNPNARAAVPVEGSPGPVYQGQNFVDRGGPGPVFAGGENVLRGAAGVGGALPEGRLATPLAPAEVPAVSADDLLDGKVGNADGGMRMAEEVKAPRSFPQVEYDAGIFPVLSALNESPVRMSRSGKEGGENDDKPTLKEMGIHYRNTHSKSGQPYDVRAQELYDAGLLREPSAEALHAAMRAEVRGFRAMRAQEQNMATEERVAVKQVKNFNNEVLRPTVKKSDERVPVAAGDLQTGDSVTVGEDVLRVVDIDPETFAVTLQDGKRYGLQTVEDGSTMWVEDMDLQAQEPAEFPVKEPARTINVTGEGNLFSEGEMPFNLQGEQDLTPELQRAADAKRAAAEAAAAASKAQGGFSFADRGPDVADRPMGRRRPAPAAAAPAAREYSTDAQVYADFPDAVGVYRSSGGWRMPIILGATDLVPVVEMPEIIELWRELTGAAPGIKVKMGDKLGYFRPSGAGEVVLRADLFQDERSALMTLMHEVGHGFHYMDSGTMARGNILGIIAGLVGHMKNAIPADPKLNAVGVEGYGFSGKAISKADRAEIMARAEADLVASLEGEVRRILMEQPVWAESGVTVEMVKGMFGTDAREAWPVMYDWFARQDAETKKAIVVAAMRGVVDPRLEHLKSRVQVGTETVETEVSTGRPPTGDELRAAFDNAVRAEMDARNIVDLKYVRDELVDLTRWWKPYDHRDAKRRAYRESGAELYADAMSVLLNSPADLKARAPVFWRAWWAYLDARPAVKAKLMEVQSRILSGREAVLSKREGLAKEGFATGAEMFLRKQAEATARRTQLAGWWEDLKDQYWDKFYPLTSAAARARSAGKITRADEDGIRWMLEEHPMADGMLQVKLADIGRIYHRLDDKRIPRADLGYLMSLQRIANERMVLEQDEDTGEVTKVTGRSVMANPGGETARTAQEQMDRLRSIWGEDKWALVTGAAADFRGVFLSVMEEGRRAGLYSDDTWARIEANADVYAAFTPVKYVQEFLPAAIRKQVGTFEQIADPVQQTTLKMIAVWRAAKNNAFVAGAVREVGRVLPEAVRDAPMKYDGKRMVPQAPKESGWKLVTWMEGGKLQGAHMLERYARMWEGQSPADRDAILRVLMTGFTNTVYSAIIRYNPAFQLFMSPVRDLQRSITNMPGGVAGRGRFVARLMDPQVWGAALDWARGDVGSSALMREMIEAAAVGGPHTAFGGRMGTADDALDGMLKKFHVQNDHKGRGIILNGLMSPLRGIEFAGQVLQMLPKAAAYKVLARDMGWSQGQAANMIRNHIGIPNYYKKGRHVAAAGSLVPFLNIFLRGYDSLARTARGAERGQSAGAWWLAWLLTGGGLITVLQTLAREGMMGDDLQKLYERIPEWDMTNYMNIPLGEVPTGAMGGKTVYARLPMDEGLRVVNATVHKALTGAIRAARGDKVKPGVGDIVSGVSATVPGINPLLAIGGAWKSYAEGQNPRDDFRNRDILTEDEWRAGGWPAVSKMMGWTLGQTGITNFFSYDRNADSLTEVAVGSTPVLNRVIKITDRGLAQSEEAQQRAEDAVMARVRASLPADVQGLRTEYYYLQRRGDRMNDEQRNRYGELSLWMKSYRRALADVETYLEMKEPDLAAQTLRDLRAESKEYRAR